MDAEKQQAAITPAAAEEADREFHFAEGVFGFPAAQYFTLAPYLPPDGSASPFMLLQAKDADLCFPLIPPDLLMPNYIISPPADLLARLDANSTADLVALAIVTLRDQVEQITVNLQGPLLLNPRSRLGCQFVAEQYPLRYPLIVSPQA
jgi:flagellar assembly factor FliW